MGLGPFQRAQTVEFNYEKRPDGAVRIIDDRLAGQDSALIVRQDHVVGIIAHGSTGFHRPQEVAVGVHSIKRDVGGIRLVKTCSAGYDHTTIRQ